MGQADKDDRPAENLSFAATNLVKPGLSSKRQQSEPPMGRNVFPPTPPPEGEKPELSRGQSVRNGPKPMPLKLNLDKSRPPQKYEVRDDPRQRTVSEARGPQRQYSTRDSSRSRRPIPEEQDDYAGDVYDMYSSRNSRNSRGNGRRQPQYIEEEDGSDYDMDAYDDGEFEMMNSNTTRRSQPRSRAPSMNARKPEVRKIRVKVHCGDDLRYVMIGTAVEYPDFTDKIKDKFGLRKRFKVKVREDGDPRGDMITLGDQDDLEMIVQVVKTQARRERADMAKMEVHILLTSVIVYVLT